MISNQHKYLYWKTNANVLLGFQPGELVAVDYRCGGGFAGAPEEIVLGPIANVAKGQPSPEPVEFPPPSTGLVYEIGGRAFMNYAYKRV